MSLFANAKVSLPVRIDILVGGITPNVFSCSANLGLDWRVSLSVLAEAINFAFSSFITLRCCSSNRESSSRTGSLNIFMVRLTISNSSRLNCPAYKRNNLKHNSTSLIQYPPYRASSSVPKSFLCLPNAAMTSVPFCPNPYRAEAAAKLCFTLTPSMALDIDNVSAIRLGFIPNCHERIAASNIALCATMMESSQSIASK